MIVILLLSWDLIQSVKKETQNLILPLHPLYKNKTKKVCWCYLDGDDDDDLIPVCVCWLSMLPGFGYLYINLEDDHESSSSSSPSSSMDIIQFVWCKLHSGNIFIQVKIDLFSFHFENWATKKLPFSLTFRLIVFFLLFHYNSLVFNT